MTRRIKIHKGWGPARVVLPFAYEFRLKVGRLYAEDGYPAKLVASQFGISENSVSRWGKSTTFIVNMS